MGRLGCVAPLLLFHREGAKLRDIHGAACSKPDAFARHVSIALPSRPADEDMFASDDEKKEDQNGASAQQAAEPAEPAAPAATPKAGPLPPAAAPKPAAAAAADETDYSSWPVKELRRFLTERGVVSGFGGASANMTAAGRQLGRNGSNESSTGLLLSWHPSSGLAVN